MCYRKQYNYKLTTSNLWKFEFMFFQVCGKPKVFPMILWLERLKFQTVTIWVGSNLKLLLRFLCLSNVLFQFYSTVLLIPPNTLCSVLSQRLRRFFYIHFWDYPSLASFFLEFSPLQFSLCHLWPTFRFLKTITLCTCSWYHVSLPCGSSEVPLEQNCANRNLEEWASFLSRNDFSPVSTFVNFLLFQKSLKYY